jgi:phosphoglucosamine mutase
MKPKLFSADGIRGIIDRPPLRREDVERLGRALAVWLREVSSQPIFLLGADTRESSQRLKISLAEGLTRGGVQVIDSGIVPTAAISYLIIKKGLFAGGAMVSASHNPIVENGIKVFNQRGIKTDTKTEHLIETLFFDGATLPYETRPAQMIIEPHLAQQYAMSLVHEFRSHQLPPYRIVVDCANGAVSHLAPLILEALGIPHMTLNVSPDGTNINRDAGSEYARVNPNLLAKKIQDYEADFGLALDGDADRVVFVDVQGQLYDGDMILAMLALTYKREHILQRNTVVTTSMSNSGLAHYLRKFRIATRVVPNGDKFITRTLLEENLTLGGEEIGHIIAHTDHSHVTGDGLRTALLVLNALALTREKTLQDLAPGMHKWPQIKASVWIGRGIHIPRAEDIPGLPSLLHQTEDAVPDLVDLECRPASTEPVYRIMLEAMTTETAKLAEHAKKIAEHIQIYLSRVGSPVLILDCTVGGCIE